MNLTNPEIQMLKQLFQTEGAVSHPGWPRNGVVGCGLDAVRGQGAFDPGGDLWVERCLVSTRGVARRICVHTSALKISSGRRWFRHPIAFEQAKLGAIAGELGPRVGFKPLNPHGQG